MATVQVGSVWPTGSTLTITRPTTITGQAITGAVSGAAFGVPSVIIAPVQFRAVTGVASAQSFGAAVLRISQVRQVSGVPSAQAFGGALKLNQFVQPAGLDPYAGFVSSITGQVISGDGHVVGGQSKAASHFGAVTIHATITVPVQGFYNYPPFVNSITGGVICGDGHIVGGYGGTGYQFGHPTIYALYRVSVGGVGSAQQFGSIKTAQRIYLSGVPSAQAFGTRIGFKFRILGLGSAQAFGIPRVFLVWMRADLCSVLALTSAQCLTATDASILNTFRCGDGTRIGSGTVFLGEPSVITLDLEPAGCV